MTSCSDGNGVTDQRQIDEKPINKLQSLYCIDFKQNVDQTIHQLKVALAVDAVYFSTDFGYEN